MRKVMILGGTSAIARAVARCFAEERARLFLAGRNEERLRETASDLSARGADRVVTRALDLTDSSQHASVMEEAIRSLEGLDTLLLAYGVLPDREAALRDPDVAENAMLTNYVSAVLWLTEAAARFEKQKSGTIAVISSVAGDRGRASNYLYGSTKAGLNAFAQGLRARLFRSHVNVLTIKPGFVDTPMTAHLRKGLLFARPDAVGRRIYRAIGQGRSVVYVPGYWRWIMCVLKAIPESIYKRIPIP